MAPSKTTTTPMTTTTMLLVSSLLIASSAVATAAAFSPSFAAFAPPPKSAAALSNAAPSPPPSFLARATTRTSALSASSSSAASDVYPIPTEWRGDVLRVLSAVVDPDLNRDIVTLGFVKNLSLNEENRSVSFDVELTTPACPVKDQFRDECHALVSSLPWVTGTVDVTMTAAPSNVDTDSAGLSQVGAVIAVSSCKGGVGKSTTAVNLAYSLSRLGASVGIFDVDVYGPSLPTMVTPDDDNVQFVGRQIAPLMRDGVKLMSFGYVNEGSAVMRGPMVTQLLDQFLSLVNWGQLDYLVLDMPPGTGDIQLTLSQRLNITAAVIVTTPQELSFADVVRGIDMFDSVNVPCVAVVENMAYYEVEDDGEGATKSSGILDGDELREAFAAKLRDTGVVDGDFGLKVDEFAADLVDIVRAKAAATAASKSEEESPPNGEESGGGGGGDDGKKKRRRVKIFGEGHKSRLSTQYGIEHTYSVPLLDRIASDGDSGHPFVLSNPASPPADTYKSLAESVVREVGKVKYSRDKSRPSVSYDPERHRIVFDEYEIPPATLRRACRCASCVEELTGRQLLDPASVDENIRPAKMEPCGNYALSVDWSNGHRSLYPYRQIRDLVEGLKEGKGAVKEEVKSI